jgi:cytochrome c oxidase assembly protein subunit 15
LIFAQGIFGWYMVKSGLIEDVTVSHYRLSLHLSTALLIISTIFWLLMNINYKTNKSFFLIKDKNLPFQFFIFLIFVQIIMGAFVSGLDAVKVYQNWPFIGNAIFKKKIYELYKPLFVVILLLSLQVILGIYTLISGLNIYLASAHQITSVLLVFGALNLYYLRAK